ncbi:2Fe-2S iron-sulfur cluster-binding protein [Kordiimonas aquimaris]|uniref:2Fe-2S iron-sulfur cluster-binding protein n=1 Tax=Kordiimonas aquimaris TaxID=707591 RepID=UPI0021D3B20F|nr:2Fe-2S iron-sulfur cluster-binding protein [Kordiimonas aquimaris]
MVKITVTDLAGKASAIEAEVGLSLMENIRNADFDDLAAVCGGCCSCCTCHVFVDSDDFERLPEMEEDEQYLLEDSDHFQTGASRLSCQIEVDDSLDGLKVTIAPE